MEISKCPLNTVLRLQLENVNGPQMILRHPECQTSWAHLDPIWTKYLHRISRAHHILVPGGVPSVSRIALADLATQRDRIRTATDLLHPMNLSPDGLKINNILINMLIFIPYSVFNSIDACESKIEIVTPYWASNSAGKIRAIVNTQHFEQAIHQEVCT